ncbi:MAG: glycosyltransferase [Rhodobacteraceae bacterium]|nr:glycosyltransferase [Paracoccaceae bacterium]
MAVVVIGFRAPAEMAAAVASLRAQDVAAEIVVVNSGGGAPEVVLAAHLDHIRLIAVEAPLMVGAARNIGIDATRAPLIGFRAVIPALAVR